MISKKLVISLNTAFVSATVQTLMKCCVVFADPDEMLCCIGISSRSSLFAFHRGLYFLLAFRSTMKMALFLFFPTIIITENLCVNVTYDPCPGPLYVKKTLFI